MMTNWSSRIDTLTGQTSQTRRQYQSSGFLGFFRLELCSGGPTRGRTPHYFSAAVGVEALSFSGFWWASYRKARSGWSDQRQGHLQRWYVQIKEVEGEMTCYSGSCNDGNLVGRLVFTSQNRIKHMGIQARAKEMPTQSGGVWQEMWRCGVAHAIRL